MRQPKGYNEAENEHDFCKLLQSIYGLKRSYVVAQLKKYSYLYKYKSEVENSLIGVYVDNMVMGGGEKK